MKFDWSFPKQIFLSIFVIGCIGMYPLVKFGSSEIIQSVFVGVFLTTVNVLLGYATIEYSLDKSTTTFFKFVIGGIGIRMLFMAIMLVLLIKLFKFHVVALISSMGIFYIVFLTLEVLYIQKKITSKQQS